MNMNHKDACKVLGLQGHVTADDIKLAYRKACAKYHPDRNPAGLETMQMVNLAYEALQGFEGDTNNTSATQADYGQAVNDALNSIIDLGLTIEICGTWVWISGDTKPHVEAFKTAGFKWAPNKKMWYFRPAEHRSFNRKPWGMDAIRSTYGSTNIQGREKTLLN